MSTRAASRGPGPGIPRCRGRFPLPWWYLNLVIGLCWTLGLGMTAAQTAGFGMGQDFLQWYTAAYQLRQGVRIQK